MIDETPPQDTAHALEKINQLDENVNAAVEEILTLTGTFFYKNIYREKIFNIIKRNIEGNVNWSVG